MKNVSVPLYQKMMLQIIHDINADILKENDKLPSEQQLGEIFNISRITVRKALDELQFRKYIYKKRGQGSYVYSRRKRNASYRYLDVAAKIHEMQLSPHSEINEFTIIADKQYLDIKKAMKLNSIDYLYRIEKTYFGNRDRLMRSQYWLSYSRFPGIKIDELEHEEVLPILYGEYNLTPDKVNVESKAARVNKEDTKYLDASVHEPKVVRKVSVIENKKLVMVEVSEVIGFLPMYI